MAQTMFTKLLYWIIYKQRTGLKTDFKIEFEKFELSDITVADSVKILQEQYQIEKQKKIESAQKGSS